MGFGFRKMEENVFLDYSNYTYKERCGPCSGYRNFAGKKRI
jgi:hypothetical protein